MKDLLLKVIILPLSSFTLKEETTQICLGLFLLQVDVDDIFLTNLSSSSIECYSHWLHQNYVNECPFISSTTRDL
jgi:hypothetical protein